MIAQEPQPDPVSVTVHDITQQDLKTNTYKSFLQNDEKVLFTGTLALEPKPLGYSLDYKPTLEP